METISKATSWLNARMDLICSALWFALAVSSLFSGAGSAAMFIAWPGVLHLMLYFKTQHVAELSRRMAIGMEETLNLVRELTKNGHGDEAQKIMRDLMARWEDPEAMPAPKLDFTGTHYEK